MCQIPYMIDNVVNIINGVQKKVDPKKLIDNCHPMGYIDELKQLAQLDNADYSLIYYTVLTDCPLSKYFEMYVLKMQEQ